VFPSSFGSIRCPVLMLDGDYDPHPGALIRAGLEPFILQLEHHELANCGHYPWREREVRGEFSQTLTGWLSRQAA
jgi:pimeloyl-ACP methyl ester carboxylesterase